MTNASRPSGAPPPATVRPKKASEGRAEAAWGTGGEEGLGGGLIWTMILPTWHCQRRDEGLTSARGGSGNARTGEGRAGGAEWGGEGAGSHNGLPHDCNGLPHDCNGDEGRVSVASPPRATHARAHIPRTRANSVLNTVLTP